VPWDPPETVELEAFVAVVEEGSVAAAARSLNLPRPTVSRRLARLEERLEARLLHRTTRKQGLTDAGEELFRHARSILAAIRDATDALRREDGVPRGLLRVSLPPSDTRFRGLIPDFLVAFPEVSVEVEYGTRYVDLVADGFDVAVRAGRSPLSEGLIARRLATMRSTAYASPDYLARRGTPETPDALAEHTCLLSFAEGVRPVTHWPLKNAGSDGSDTIRVRGRLVSNDLPTLVHACAMGLGIALLPDRFVQDTDLALVPVLEDTVGADGHLSIVYAEREFMPPAVRAFVDFASDWLKAGFLR
jgi:DNA-binding transcriptional LysR family regulator